MHLYWVLTTSFVSIKKKKNQRTLKCNSSVRLLWNKPAERWVFIDKLRHLNVVPSWRTTHGGFVAAISPPILGSPSRAEGPSSDELWPLVSLKYPTQACVASWDCPGAAPTRTLYFRLNSRSGNKAGTSRNGRATHTGQFGAQNLNCCSSLKDCFLYADYRGGPVILYGYCIYLGKVAWIPNIP